MPNPDLTELRRLAEELKAPRLNEKTMERLNTIRSIIEQSPMASYPRDIFESILDGADQQLEDAARAILFLLDRLEAAEARGYKLGTEDAAKWHEQGEILARRGRDDPENVARREKWDIYVQIHLECAAAIRKLEPKP
jgi:hypothetical protein